MTTWTVRKDALMDRALALQLSLSYPSPIIQARLGMLLQCYMNFLDAHFTYLHNGFYGVGGFTSSIEYPPDHVMHVTLNQASNDLDVIERLIDQRLHSPTPQANILFKADFLADDALKPASALLVTPPAVFTYYNKSPSICLVPYANVALIGIPYTAALCSTDLLAIPHEVGHYLYWHGSGLRIGSMVEEYIHPGHPQIFVDITIDPSQDSRIIRESALYNWQEEIFADFYGSKIAGPLIANDFQDYQLRNRENHFVRDDGEHPTPAYRPNIYTSVVDPIWRSILNTQWIAVLAARSITNFSLSIDPKKFLEKGVQSKSTLSVIKTRLESSASSINSFSDVDLNPRINDIINVINSRTQNITTVNTFWDRVKSMIDSDLPPVNNPTPADLYDAFDKVIFENASSSPTQIALQVDLNTEAALYDQNRPLIGCRSYAAIQADWNTKWASTLIPTESTGMDWLPSYKADGWTSEAASNPWST